VVRARGGAPALGARPAHQALAEAEAMKPGCKEAVLFTMLIHAPGALERVG
jgi:hypothetical protein